MLRRYKIGLVVAVPLVSPVAMFFWSTASAQSASDVVGTWTLVSSVTEKDGARTDQFGSGAKGMLTLDADGHFMLTIIGPDLPKFVSNNRASGTPEENKAVMSKSIAMIGTYSVDSGRKDAHLQSGQLHISQLEWNRAEAVACIQQQGRTQIRHTIGVQRRSRHGYVETGQVKERVDSQRGQRGSALGHAFYRPQAVVFNF